MNVEIDLPPHFRALHQPSIDRFLEGAIPGSTLCIHLGDARLLAGFINCMAVERNTVELRLCYQGRDLVLAPADLASRRLVERDENRLTKALRNTDEIRTVTGLDEETNRAA
jgi:hypothetical protein